MANGTIQQFNGNKVLWTGASYMGNGITASLSEKISTQKNGIVLAWSAYVNGTAQNYDWVYHFVPKDAVSGNDHIGVGFFLATADLSKAGGKYIYFDDQLLTGYSTNSLTGTGASQIKYTNDYWVLREVYGV